MTIYEWAEITNLISDIVDAAYGTGYCAGKMEMVGIEDARYPVYARLRDDERNRRVAARQGLETKLKEVLYVES